MTKPSNYKRLPGRGSGNGIIRPSRQSLWQGEDHILFVNNRGYTESYKKFYFKDIQAIILHKTFRGQLWNVLLGLALFVTGCFILAGFMHEWSTPAMVVSFIIFGLFAFFLVANILLGPSCACYIQTAVQRERLYAVYRLRTGRKFLNRVRPLLEAAQGPLDEDVMRESFALDAPDQTQLSPVADRKKRATLRRLNNMPKIRKHSSGITHLVLFLLLSVNCVVDVVTLLSYSMVLLLVGLALFACINVVTLMAIVKQHKTDIPKAVVSLVFATLAYIFVIYFTGAIESGVFKATHLHHGSNIEIYKAFLDVSPWESRFRMFNVMLSLIPSGVIGFTGLGLIMRFRRTSSLPPPAPAIPPEATGAPQQPAPPVTEDQTIT